MAAVLERVEHKLRDHEHLTRDDARELFATDDVIRLGRLADTAKRARWDDRAHFVINRQINPSNVCVLSCRPTS